MTLSQIAQLANVSVSTVSKAFADNSEISASTKENIFRIARENNCFEKYYKGKYPKKIIAVMCPEIQSELYYRIVTILDECIRKKNAVMVVSVYNFDEKQKKEMFEYHAFVQKADGIIIIGTANNIINKSHVPAIAFCDEENSRANNIDIIPSTMNKYIFETVKYLCDNGHTEIGYIGEKKTISKYNTFAKALKQYGVKLNKDYIKTSFSRFEDAGYSAMNELIESGHIPTAIFCAYDYIALGAIKSAREHGLKIPDDLSIIGSDGITVGKYLETPLTSISMDYEEACTAATDMLIKKIENKYLHLKSDKSPDFKLIKRKSVKNLKE